MSDAAPEITVDRVLGGRVSLRQPAIGYRAGLDAALLAAASDARPGERVLDLGCGPGGALLQAAARAPEAHFTGLDRDAGALRLLAQSAADNGFAERVRGMEGDVGEGVRALEPAGFDLALCNPPFFDDPAAMRAPHPARTGAYMADDGLEAWTRFLVGAVREGGRLVVIHRAERLADLLSLLSSKAGSLAVRPVHPFADAPAKRVLVRALRSGRAPLRLLPGLVLHVRGGGHTPEANALLRGETALGWD